MGENLWGSGEDSSCEQAAKTLRMASSNAGTHNNQDWVGALGLFQCTEFGTVNLQVNWEKIM